MAVTAVSANDHMVFQPGNIFHKPTGFKIFIDFSVNDKLGDPCNGKCKSTPAGNEQDDGKDLALLAQWNYFAIPYRSDRYSGHEQGIDKRSVFDNHIPYYPTNDNDVKDNKGLEQFVSGGGQEKLILAIKIKKELM